MANVGPPTGSFPSVESNVKGNVMPPPASLKKQPEDPGAPRVMPYNLPSRPCVREPAGRPPHPWPEKLTTALTFCASLTIAQERSSMIAFKKKVMLMTFDSMPTLTLSLPFLQLLLMTFPSFARLIPFNRCEAASTAALGRCLRCLGTSSCRYPEYRRSVHRCPLQRFRRPR